ncbi:MAG: AAA family ATPase [Candidatus Nanoarchaeia archaeon]|nr:AAA family ATPase [Candidatus Nanoarchaeia archaeon]
MEKKPKVIVVTGISGSRSKEFCTKYAPESKSVKVYHTGDMLYEKAKESFKDYTPKENLLNIELSTLNLLRNSVFKQIADEIKNPKKEYDRIIIDTHAKFFWNYVYHNAFDLSYLNMISADLFITIIDKPSAILTNQRRKEMGRAQKHDLEDILFWQNNEVDTTEHMSAVGKQKPFYILPSKQDPIIIENLLKSKFLIYLSMPMTDCNSEANSKVTDFAEKLNNVGIEITGCPTPVIDPRTIDIEHDKEILKFMGKKDASELDEAEKQVFERFKLINDSQTIHRDLNWYIGKSTHVVAYYPPGTEISKGVSDECTRAFESRKYVYVVFPKKNKSPFIRISHDVFENGDEFLDFFKNHIKSKINDFKRSDKK